MKHIIDIETSPRPVADIEHLCPKFSAPANYKDADKIAANIAEQKAAWLERAALSPITGSIVAIGYRSGPITRIVTIKDGMTEADLLNDFWDVFGTDDDMTQFIGHNLHGFDLPFIIRRSWFHGIRVPSSVFENGGRYVNGRRFLDTMKAFQCGNAREDFIGLDRLAKWLGLAGKTDDIGATFAQVLEEDRERAIAYLTRDLELTEAIARRIGIL